MELKRKCTASPEKLNSPKRLCLGPKSLPQPLWNMKTEEWRTYLTCNGLHCSPTKDRPVQLNPKEIKNTEEMEDKDLTFNANRFYKQINEENTKHVVHQRKTLNRKKLNKPNGRKIRVSKKKYLTQKAYQSKKRKRFEEPTVKMEKECICRDVSVSPKLHYQPKYERSPVSSQKKRKFFTHRDPLASSPSKLPKIIMKLGHRRLSMPFKINSDVKKKLVNEPMKPRNRRSNVSRPLNLNETSKEGIFKVEEEAEVSFALAAIDGSSSEEEMVLLSRSTDSLNSSQTSTNTKEPLVTPFTLSVSRNRTRNNLSCTRQDSNSTNSSTSSETSSPLVFRCRKKKVDNLEQLIIDAGQKEIGAISCGTCGMVFTACDEEDKCAHIRYHNKLLFHLRFQGWKKERVLKEYHDGRIIAIHPDDANYAQQKLEEVLSVVDSDLGFADTGIRNKSKCKFYLFISCEKSVVGCLITELISQAYRIVQEPLETNVINSENRKTWCCKTDSEKAVCGISRIWTLASHRRKKIGTRLVDCARENFIFGYILNVGEIAFSDPTPNGRLFASNYTKMSSFLVYK